jgi:N-acetylglucosamine repressor
LRAVPSLLRHINARRVMELLWRQGAVSRAELVRRTGISAPTMSRLVEGLRMAGFLEVEPAPRALLGRPAARYRPASLGSQVVGVNVGIRECQVVSGGLDGLLPETRRRVCVTPRTYDGLVESLSRTIREVISLCPARCLGVGLSVPGLITERERRLVFSPNLHFLDGRPLGDDLQRRLGLFVLLHQEEHGFCLAERFFGAARGVEHFAVVDISDGLGMGVVSGGRLVTGARGYGGEIGHITVRPGGEPCGCGNRGCLETVATDLAFARGVSRRLGRPVDIEAATAAVRAGVVSADEELLQTLEALAIGIGAVVNLFNPELVLVNGRILDAGEGLLDQLTARVRHYCLRPSFESCRFARTATRKPLGAVAAVMDRLCGPSLPS